MSQWFPLIQMNFHSHHNVVGDTRLMVLHSLLKCLQKYTPMIKQLQQCLYFFHFILTLTNGAETTKITDANVGIH